MSATTPTAPDLPGHRSPLRRHRRRDASRAARSGSRQRRPGRPSRRGRRAWSLRRRRNDFDGWLADGTLVRDTEPSFYLYQMDYRDDRQRRPHPRRDRRPRPEPPGRRSDPPARAHHAQGQERPPRPAAGHPRQPLGDLGPVPDRGLTGLCRVDADPDESWTDEDGVAHHLWVVDDPDRTAAISAAVRRHRSSSPTATTASRPRWPTATSAEAGDDPAGAAVAMVYVVELVEDELTVRPIHRLLSGRSVDGARGVLRGSLRAARRRRRGRSDPGTHGRGRRVWRSSRPRHRHLPAPPRRGLRPTSATSTRAASRRPWRRSTVSRSATSTGSTRSWPRCMTARPRPACCCARPPSPDRRHRHQGGRMPPKTTFFHPKPRTGLVFRPTD